MTFTDISLSVRRDLKSRLSDRQYLVYGLRLNGSSWESISELLEIPVWTARTHFKKADAIHRSIIGTVIAKEESA